MMSQKASLPVLLAVCGSLLLTACTSKATPGQVAQPSAQTASTAGQTTPVAEPTALAPGQTAQSAISCSGVPTPAETEGPYYTAGAPERTSLVESGVTGTKFALSGYVLTQGCKPVAGATVQFWQANDSGQYDNSGYTLRGTQQTDANGRYTLATVVPGLYPGRTRHIHVKVQAPGQPVLTTQLYFPDEAQNAADGIFRKESLMDVQKTADGEVGTFNFVLAMK